VKVPVFDITGGEVRQIEISDAVFGVPFNEAAVHQVMVGMQANLRQGTADSKSRGDIVGSTKKLYRQKGTGYARAGSKKSPTRRGGGSAFGPKPRDYRQSIPKKLRQLAIRCILSSKAGDGDLKILDNFNFEEPKTSKMAQVLDALKIDSPAVIITEKADTNVVKSARNIPQVITSPAGVINILDILSHKTLVMTEAAVRVAEKLWGGSSAQEGK
jgi:large subunit ribosomal protein L4